MLLAPLVARSHPAVRAAQDNYADTTKFICATKTCVLNRNTFVNRSATPPAPWPAAAQAVMAGAGVRPEARKQMHPDAAGTCRNVPGLKTDDMAVTALALAVAVLPAAGLDNGLSLTPPMGFNMGGGSFIARMNGGVPPNASVLENKWHCLSGTDGGINETMMKKAADYLHSSGMFAAGYDHVHSDDCCKRNGASFLVLSCAASRHAGARRGGRSRP